MSIQEIEVSRAELDAQDWQAVIGECPEKTVHGYRSALSKKASVARDAGDLAAHKVFQFLAALMHFVPDYESPEDVFITMYVSGEGRRTALPADLSESQLDLLAQLLGTIEDAELRAHIADVLWTRRRDYRAALTASKSYLESGQLLLAAGDVSASAQRLERSLRLAARIRNRTLLSQIVEYIEGVLYSGSGAGHVFWTARMLELLLEHGQGAPDRLAQIAGKHAAELEVGRNWHVAGKLWELQARCYAANNAPDEERQARVKAAETYVQQAEDDKARSYGVAAEDLRTAVQAYRRIGAAQERIEELHTTLLDYQQKAASEMGAISVELHLGEVADRARSCVTGLTFDQAIVNLATLATSPTVSELKSAVDDIRGHAVLSSRITHQIVNAAGRVVGVRPPLASENAEERAEAEKLEMFRVAALHRLQIVLGIVEPARLQIKEEHAEQNDWTWLLVDNPFVPQGREVIYARGLQAGLDGDFLIATHLLIPQLENSLRYILVQLGEIASGINDNLIQDEYLLDRILRHERLAAFLGEDTIFDLKSVLIERAGGNVRNLLAHGLLDAQHFESADPKYAWWLTLRLCCLVYLSAKGNTEGE